MKTVWYCRKSEELKANWPKVAPAAHSALPGQHLAETTLLSAFSLEGAATSKFIFPSSTGLIPSTHSNVPQVQNLQVQLMPSSNSCKRLTPASRLLINPHPQVSSQARIRKAKNRSQTGFPGGSDGKESASNAGDLGLIPGSGRSPGEGNDSPLQYSCLENPMNRGAWRATVHGVPKSQTWLSS